MTRATPAKTRAKHWTIKLAAFLIPLTSAIAQACPMCKDSVPSSDAQSAAGVPTGLNTSVYFMLTGFFTVLGLVSFMIVKQVKETDARIMPRGPRSPRGFPIDQDPDHK